MATPDGRDPGVAVIPVTAIITTRNEQINIEKCLRSIRDLVDQILVIDSESEDGTVAVARRYADGVYNLTYVHGAVIPWIFQWGLDNLPIRNEWVLILEADQTVPPELQGELRRLFGGTPIRENGFFIRRKQMFRGRWIRFGGYGSKYLLKLFRRRVARLDAREQDTRVYVQGALGKLRQPLVEENLKESEILFYLGKHLRYADAFAREEYERRRHGMDWALKPSLFGTPDERTLWLKTVYYRMPLYTRTALYFLYRYVVRLGILDGKEGAIFHFLQAFWFRLVVDIRLEELMARGGADAEALPLPKGREAVSPPPASGAAGADRAAGAPRGADEGR
jgi:glycosyltransferase involved in cell wall biosynthesis